MVRRGWLRTSRSSTWIKSEAPTPLETDLDIESDLVTVPRAPSAPRRCALQRLKPWLPQTTTSLISAASKAFSLRKSRSCLRAATTAGGVEARRVFRACPEGFPKNSPAGHPLAPTGYSRYKNQVLYASFIE